MFTYTVKDQNGDVVYTTNDVDDAIDWVEYSCYGTIYRHCDGIDGDGNHLEKLGPSVFIWVF